MNKSLKMTTKNLDFYYGDFHALKDISLDFHSKQAHRGVGKALYYAV